MCIFEDEGCGDSVDSSMEGVVVANGNSWDIFLPIVCLRTEGSQLRLYFAEWSFFIPNLLKKSLSSSEQFSGLLSRIEFAGHEGTEER